MDYSDLEAADGVVDVVEVALTKGLSAAKMTTLQRVSSHPKALHVGPGALCLFVRWLVGVAGGHLGHFSIYTS